MRRVQCCGDFGPLRAEDQVYGQSSVAMGMDMERRPPPSAKELISISAEPILRAKRIEIGESHFAKETGIN